MLYFIFTITLIYCLLITTFIIGFEKIKVEEIGLNLPEISFSIIIPFRNETKSLPQLLESIYELDYPSEMFEILMIDDNSTDTSKLIIESFIKEKQINNIHILENIRKSNSPKKDAIETAIKKAKFDWIITTDADCIIPKSWLKEYNCFLNQNDSKMICGPVTYTTNNSFFEKFQLLDLMSLIGVTIGGFGIKKPFLCNGANLCYFKKVFFEVDGFHGNNDIASGDDIFLLEKISSHYPDKVHYLKSNNAIVTTSPPETLKQLIFQRLRWASKTSSYKNWFGKFIGITVFLMNFSILYSLIISIIKKDLVIPFILIFSIKLIIDFIIIYKTLRFTKQSKNIIFYPFSAFLYPFFNVFVVFLTFLKKKYTWKGRSFSS